MRARLLVVACAILGSVGCWKTGDRIASEPALESRATPGGVPDRDITSRIREKLVAGEDPLSSQAQSVSVVAEAGVVTLIGSVENQREKALVLAIARQTDGVARIEDRLEIARR
jgi:osmotically-inducible protein OsmY